MSIKKVELKKQLQQIGIKVAGNYVRKKDIEKALTKVKATYTYTIVDNKAASACVGYLLDTEAEDYGIQAKDNGLTEENWDSINHVYVSALKAIGKTPDPDFFE